MCMEYDLTRGTMCMEYAPARGTDVHGMRPEHATDVRGVCFNMRKLIDRERTVPNMALEKIDIATLDPKRTIVVATGNAHKLTEIEAILSEVLPEVRFVALGQLGDFEDPEETGTTFVENAIIKAEAAVAATGLAAIADDSGLVVDALDGEPGVYSARYAGVHGDDAANNAKLLDKLGDTPDAERTARFMSVVALIDASGCVLTGTGACEGVIAREGRGEHGFGYDPLFLPVDTPGKTMAELTPEEKNAISHRFHALQDLSAQLVQAASAEDAERAGETGGAECPSAPGSAAGDR
ncbi:non-canonical purine NTP pyrophosphatase, RdgB/HAM1 family [Collinsella stercoris DSM 13279]|uniref:dITP/XTP pyrophosphatase n=2 Tax=Collinsella TaxID=102106 RepID=B6GB03_9ACTN|nr:non-canonical purine NTP pyrophosphatase, RdgB/HAM1 family [Collinsella stercoris DSM 13279]